MPTLRVPNYFTDVKNKITDINTLADTLTNHMLTLVNRPINTR